MKILPLALESQSVTRSGPKCLYTRFVIVGPKAFSWSEPIHIRYLKFKWISQFVRLKSTPDKDQDSPIWTLFTIGYQFGYLPTTVTHTCRHVERAAPRPVPVQTRMPRLYMYDVLDTPANYGYSAIIHMTTCGADSYTFICRVHK